jgi:competence protein ComEC
MSILKRRSLIILSFLAFLNAFAWIAVFDLARSKNLEVVFFDVGQGDAAFIETPRGHQILIDGGPDSSLPEKLAKEMPFWDRTIDLIILTHPEKDHMAGLIEVLRSYKVENVLWTGVVRNTADCQEWIKLTAEEGARMHIAESGLRVKIGQAFLYVLHPFENLEGKNIEDSNNTSVIARIVFKETSFLFTGDAYQSAENKIISLKADLDSDVLKAGHHGSKTSTGKEFVEAVSPKFAIISCGRDNSYGHPSPEALEALEGAEILRTDREGNIKFMSDGREVWLD